MNLRNHMLSAATAFMAAGTLLPAPAVYAQPAEEEVQVLTRGPVHEAFAESVSFEAEAGIIISNSPPEAIEEMPPEQQLEGDNVTWIPGYWTWDDDQNDFIWISGIWRNLPPGREWVPGYWTAVDGGRWQWTSGYWADSRTDEVEYVSTAPPKSIDAGPNIAAPSPEHTWVPGYWFWVDTRYVWRPGYWVPLRVNWTWVPSRYCWSPRGFIYVDGYWDYAVARRGVLFAPVYFHHRAYARPNYYYTPAIVVSLEIFSSHLFVRPRCSHYYFGDYYAPRYRDSGFYASFSWHSGRHGYDPIYAYDRWDHRGDRDWDRRRRADFDYYRDHEDARPPHTWAAMRDIREDRMTDGRRRNYASTLSGFAQQNKSGQKFRAMDEDRRKQFVSQRQEMRKFGQERQQMEIRRKDAGDDGKKAVTREKLTRSPIKGREEERFAKDEAPPKRPEARPDKSRVMPGTKDKPKADEPRKSGDPNADKRRGPDKERQTEPNDKPRRDKDATPDTNRDKKTPDADREKPRRETDTPKNERKTPKREEQVTPKREIQTTPQGPDENRKPQVSPKREVQPTPQRPDENRKPQVSPKREVQAAPQRPAENRKPQVSPKREVQAAPQRAVENRKPQVSPRREVQTAPQRPAENRKPQVSPRREVQTAPQRPAENRKPQATPREVGPSHPKTSPSGKNKNQPDEEELNKGRRTQE